MLNKKCVLYHPPNNQKGKRPMKELRKRRVNLALPKTFVKDLIEASDAKEISMTSYVILAVREFMAMEARKNV